MSSVFFEVLSESLRTVGEIMIAYMAVRVHYRFRKEHQIDERVFLAMKKEQWVGIVGIVVLILGYLLKLYSLSF